MEPREEKDAKTLLIARALALFVVVTVASSLVLLVAHWWGVDGLETWLRVAVAVAVLLAVRFLMRRRDT